jgi:hypothetical protein
VDENWASLREDWAAKCKEDNLPQDCADLLLFFESHLKWDVLREAWIADLK